MEFQKTELLGADASGIARAAEILRAGRTVGFPTETVYGLGADATNGRAVAAIYAAKGRPSFNPLIVHVPDLAAATALVELGEMGARLAEAFWPGALTLVAPMRAGAGVDPLVTAGLSTLAVRVPSSALAQRVLAEVGRPVAAPSANPSGKISPTAAAHVMAGLSGRIGAVLDGGPCPVGVESTIVGVGEAPVLLRAGGVSREALEDVLVCGLAAAGEAITAPGMLASHYAPNARLRLNAKAPEAGERWVDFGPARFGGETLSEAADLEEAAARLFSVLHRMDAEGEGPIAVARVPKEGLGLAINDRLKRAAAPRG
ncbi:MAG: L-threonylcarbamoyladenylate synthase [Pseudomonadota bacterium]